MAVGSDPTQTFLHLQQTQMQRDSALNSFNNFRTTQFATRNQENQSTWNQVAKLDSQTRAEKQKTAAEIHQIRQETQTKISEMQRTTYINKAKSSSGIHKKLVALMMS